VELQLALLTITVTVPGWPRGPEDLPDVVARPTLTRPYNTK